jgi:hypothetical protein
VPVAGARQRTACGKQTAALLVAMMDVVFILSIIALYTATCALVWAIAKLAGTT